MFKIGDFSKLSRVSVKTLRYYAEIGLLEPIQVDPYTGYRYYAASQLVQLNRILALKDLGFSLEQISQLIDKGFSQEELRGALRLRQLQINQEITLHQERLALIEIRLKQLEQEQTMSEYEIVVKKIDNLRVASAAGMIPQYQECGPIFDRLFDELCGYLDQQGIKNVGKGFALYHDDGTKEQDISVEACAPVYEPVQASDRIQVYDLPGADLMASVVHNGPFSTLHKAYAAIITWIQANDYQIIGPCREWYLAYQRGADQSHFVTEIQYPIARS